MAGWGLSMYLEYAERWKTGHRARSGRDCDHSYSSCSFTDEWEWSYWPNKQRPMMAFRFTFLEGNSHSCLSKAVLKGSLNLPDFIS